MRMLRWMSTNTLTDRIKNEKVRGKLWVASLEDK